MSNSPIWLCDENIQFYDEDQFAVILIGNKYYPIGRFTGHLTLSGCNTLENAKAFSTTYYQGD